MVPRSLQTHPQRHAKRYLDTSALVRDVVKQASDQLKKPGTLEPETLDFLIQKLADAWNLTDE